MSSRRKPEPLRLPLPSPPKPGTYLPISAVKPDQEPPGIWHVTVCTADNARLIWHGEAPDYVQARALAGEARAHDARFQIWLRSPSGRVFAW